MLLGFLTHAWRKVAALTLQQMMHIYLILAGVPSLRETLGELDECRRQIFSESVRKHAGLLQILQARSKELCRLLTCIIVKDA